MLAYVLKSIGGLYKEDVQMPTIKKGWALVKVMACGICSSDLPRIFNKGTYHFPTIPGHEFSGLVVDIDEEHKYLLNKRVGVFPLLPCGECEQCKLKKYEMCENYDYIGSRRDGAFAEYVSVPIWNLVEMSDSVSFEQIAMMEPLSVALSAIKKINLICEKSVAVIGTGMIGISAAVFASFFSKDVTVIGRNEEKRKYVSKVNNVKYCYQLTENMLFDAVVEAVGTNASIAQAISITKPGGTIVLMGNPSSDIKLDQRIYWMILRKQISLIGTWNSQFDGNNKSVWTEIRDLLSKDQFDFSFLISHRFFKDHLFDGLNLMRNHNETYCKVMTIWEDQHNEK